MYLPKINRRKDGKDHYYWALVESRRTVRGPHQHIVAYLDEMDHAGHLGIKRAAEGRNDQQGDLFDDIEPEWVEVNIMPSA